MIFPDQSHINIVRDALHQRSGNGASVMVGSGFSKNAERTPPGTKEMPAWQDLVAHFYDALYPPSSTTPRGDNPRPATDNVRIAQEYEAARGRAVLHDTIRRLVPDMEYTPGIKHQRLLKLPWRDIYTTNWDTLLERAQSQVSEQHYNAVTSVEEIPMAGRPRIVKLHGSLPAQFPLIVTEEDYRTYPTKFAPFVNTVQQSMMETVFLLIGFSGDDPNFLNWSGWVRDNLGTAAPKIYLAGWLGLSSHRRRMLENHNVVPIDLAQHPQAGNWPESLRHDYATEWLLRTLEIGIPYDITSWPKVSSDQRDEIPSHLQPIEPASLDEPQRETDLSDVEPEASPNKARGIAAIWRHNRSIYPGWLTMPFSNRSGIERNTNAWKTSVLASLPELEPVERLTVLREITWREHILLAPMHPDFLSTIRETLDLIDCHNRTIDSVARYTEDWTSIREDWRNVAVELLTAARFQFDQEMFEQVVRELEPFQDEDPDLRHRIHHEKCLQALYDMDLDKLDTLLNDWRTENCDPAWIMRRSALLWEIHRDEEAEQTLRYAITTIKTMPQSNGSLASFSRESWATFVTLADWTLPNRENTLTRLGEFVPLRCDVFGERQSVTDGMERGRTEEAPPSFDINRRRSATDRYSNYDPLAAAYRAIRLSEMAGLPPFANHSTVWAEVLRKAATEVADYNLELAMRLTLRAYNRVNDNTLENILTRTRVAAMPAELAGTLIGCCLNAMEKAVRDKVTLASATQNRFNTAAEALSRLTIRLEPDQAESILNKAVGYCQNAELMQSSIGQTVENLLSRAWEALPDEYRQRVAIDLLSTEIVGLTPIEPIIEHLWPDPGEVVADTDTRLFRTPENEPQWQSAIDLVVQGLTGNETARRRASIRMIPLLHSNLLNQDESQKIAVALWTEKHTGPSELPRNTRLYDWQFLTLPEPTPGLAQERFRAKWLSERIVQLSGNSANDLNHNDPRDVASRLWQAGRAIQSLQRNQKDLLLSPTDIDNLAGLLEIWAEDPVPEQELFEWSAFFGNSLKRLMHNITEALPSVIGQLTISPHLGNKIYEKMRQLTANNLPAFALVPGLVKINPEWTAALATALRVGLTSDDEEIASNAARGLYLWLETASNTESNIPQPPEDLVREVGIAIASRRNTVITAAMELAAWIYGNGQDPHKEAIQQLVEDGLRYLAEELRYDRQHNNPDEVPRKRFHCAKLAAAMAQCGLGENPAVARWLEIAQEDPLPEVRRAVTEHGPHQGR